MVSSENASVDGAPTPSASEVHTGRSLKSLAPEFVEDWHGTYLRHLKEQVANTKNLNIALTGRYGTGKSSILDRFEETHRSDTVRLGISSLDPAAPNVALTNRLQKEIVKQLLYQAPAGKLRLSRFNRIARRNLWATYGQSMLLVASVAGFLALPGWLPQLAGTSKGHPWLLGAAAWLGFGLLVAGLVTAARLLVLDRKEVTDLSAGGASVKLTAKNATYFDEYLDEIVYFFDEISPKYVIFEDLDRFEDPHIFEALRELNTLLNSTQKRRNSEVSVQFIYAIKDSLFERLGADTRSVTADQAAAETKRANRTKFFEVVIPVVPFISHRNARELLSDEFKDRGITGIDRQLIDLVARHATDMRLLHNVCNEYLVFAERLLGTDRVAPGLNPTRVFALVAYKNFNLKDFELIARRESALDALYDASRDLITDAVAATQQKKRNLSNNRARSGKMSSVAAQLNDRLTRMASLIKDAPQWSGMSYYWFRIDGKSFDASGPATYDFWKAIAEGPALEVFVSNNEKADGHQVLALDKGDVAFLFPEAVTAGQWDDFDANDTRAQIAALDKDIAYLRGAGFEELVREPRFTGEDAKNFTTITDETMVSVLAQDLVKRGFIDRNFTLYAAQYYGHFSGLDVATFLVQNVNTNTMEINYSFSGHAAIKSLLAEAPEDFTSSVAAFNIAVLDYLLDKAADCAAQVVDHMLLGDSLTQKGSDASEFLAAFLNADFRPERLVAVLARRGWRGVFKHLVSDESVPEDLRVTLMDAALAGANPKHGYELKEDVRDFIVEHYPALPTITRPQPPAVTKAVGGMLAAADVVIPDLEPLSEAMRTLVVDCREYALTGSNLRSALSTSGPVSLDAIIGHKTVSAYCLDQPDLYFAAVEDDPETLHAVEQPPTLIDVLAEVAETWTEPQIGKLLRSAAPSSRLERFTDAPEPAWTMLAETHMVISSLENLDAYRAHAGSINHSLAELLTHAGQITTTEDDEQSTRMTAAVAVLGSAGTLQLAELRVKLAGSLELDDYIDPASLTPEPGPMLGLLVRHELVEDEGAVFEAFKSAGWEPIEAAISESKRFVDFASPSILIGLVAEALTSSQVPERVKIRIVEDLDAYVPDADEPALRAAASFAVRKLMALPVSHIQRIATVTQDAATVVPLVAAANLDAATTVSVLAQLPTPYIYFSTRAQAEFTVPDDVAHRKVLGVLDSGGVATSKKVRRKDLREVKLR